MHNDYSKHASIMAGHAYAHHHLPAFRHNPIPCTQLGCCVTFLVLLVNPVAATAMAPWLLGAGASTDVARGIASFVNSKKK